MENNNNFTNILKKLKGILTKSTIDTTKYTLPLNKLSQQRFTRNINQTNRFVNDLNKLISQITPVIPSNVVNLLNTAKTLYQTVPEFYQAINTVVDNVLSPDSITKTSINKIVDINNDMARIEVENNIESIFSVLGMEDIVTELVLDFILFGNAYVWIKTPGELRRLEIIDESRTLNNQSSGKISNKKIADFLVEDFSFSYFNAYTGSINSSEVHPTTTLSENFYTLPASSVQTTDETYPITQLEIEKLPATKCMPLYVGRKFLGITLVNISTQTYHKLYDTTNVSFDANDYNNSVTLANLLYNTLTQKVTTLKSLLEPDNSSILSLFYSLSSYVIQNKLKVSNVIYIPAEYCVHFKIPSSLLEPYGEPFGIGSMQMAKYLLAAEMSQIVYRLTRAVEKRVFKINAQEEHTVAKYIQDIINVTKRKEVAIRNAPDTESIINEVTMFEDYYIPTVNGESALDIEVLPAGDLTGRMDDLDYFRKKVISGLGIPAIYLVQEDTSESKYTLSQENIKFARMIIKLQKYFGKYLTDTVRKIYKLSFSDYTNIGNIFLQLKPPRAIQIEKDAEITENVNRIINSIKENAGDLFDTKQFIKDTLSDILGSDYIVSERSEQRAQRLDKLIKPEGGEEL